MMVFLRGEIDTGYWILDVWEGGMGIGFACGNMNFNTEEEREGSEITEKYFVCLRQIRRAHREKNLRFFWVNTTKIGRFLASVGSDLSSMQHL